MMKIYFGTVMLLAFGLHFSYAQDQTIGKKEEVEIPVGTAKQENTITGKVMLIPFDNKMYMSDIDRDIAAEHKINFNQVRGKFRQELNANLFNEISKSFKVISMLSEDTEVTKDLSYIYFSIGYKYELLPVKEEAKETKTPAEGIQALFNGGNKKEETATSRTSGTSGIKNGQVATVPDNREKYMNTVITNPKMFSYLNEKYGSEFYVFINQLDIKKSVDADQYSIEKNAYEREIKVHYTVFDKNGNQLGGGAAFSYFPSKINNLHSIVNNFPGIAKNACQALPKLQPEKAETPNVIEGK